VAGLVEYAAALSNACGRTRPAVAHGGLNANGDSLKGSDSIAWGEANCGLRISECGLKSNE